MKLRFEVRDFTGLVFARCASEADAREIASKVEGRTVWFLTKAADVRSSAHARRIKDVRP